MTLFDTLPKIPDRRIAIHVKPAAERAFRDGHPWVFDQAIRKQSHEGNAGDLAVIFDQQRRFLAIGLYDPDSPIRVKVLQHRQQVTVNREWFTQRLNAALTHRAPLLATDTDGYRAVHGENDGFPGLILDRYADTWVLKLYTAAWLPHLSDICASLQDLHPIGRLILRMSRNMQAHAATFGLTDGLALIGDAPTEPVRFQENGLTFAADVVHGHKTGFFFDQRENRAAIRALSVGKRVLDVFAYSGGFSVYAAAGGATEVLSLDVSAPALAAAQANFALNHANANIRNAHHEIMVADAFAGLQQLHDDERVFDLVIVDPPSFAKQANEVSGALKAYRQLAQLAEVLVAPRGDFVMASCSSRVTADQFFETVRDAVPSLHVNTQTAHALDHPIGFAEGAYLKCLYATHKG